MFSINRLQLPILALMVSCVFFNIARHANISGHSAEVERIPPHIEEAVEGAGGDPQARARYEWLRLHDPTTGLIPLGIRERELTFATTLPSTESRSHTILNKSTQSQVSTWNERGPENIGGRTRALAYDISDSTTILAGGVSGGMWRSTDGGSTWNKTTSAGSLQSVSCLAQDTRSGHRSTWYYGTGEYRGNSADGGGSAYYNGDGVFKSTDGGLSWANLSSTSSGTPQSFDQFFDYVWNVATDPSNASQDVVYAATYGAIYRSTNGGMSWSVVLGGSSPYSNMTDVQVTSTGVAYATASSGSTMSGIWRSTNGTTWTNITPSTGFASSYGRMVIGIAPSNENVMYVLLEGATSGTRTNTHQLWKYTYLSGDGSGTGGSWVNRGGNLPNQSGLSGNAVFDTQGGYDMLVKVKPDNENFLIVGGTNLYRSTDAFATTSNWTRIGGYAGPTTYSLYTNHHPDQHAGAFKPGTSLTFISGDDGGVQRTMNDSASTVVWTSLDNSYFTTQFYAVGLDHGTIGDNGVVGGMQDNGSWLTTSSDALTPWTNELSGDGTFCAIADGGASLYVSAQNSQIYRITGTGYVEVDPTGGTGYLFVNPFTLDPNNNSIMYLAGGSVLWRNSNVTAIPVDNSQTTKSTNWLSLSNTTVSGHTISAVAVSKSPANTVYFGTDNGELFKLTGANSGNPSPTDIWTGKGFPSGAYVSCIAVDREGGDSAIAVFSNYSVISLFWTTNAGSSWTNISGNLEQNSDGSGDGPSCRWATIVHGLSSVHYYVATSTGIYSTTSLNDTLTVWSQEGSSEIGNVVADMIDARESDGTVIAGTHGNGVFSTTIADPLPVELVNLSASAQGTSATISWSTATEVNNYGFDLERSDPSSAQWLKIGFVKGAGTSSALRRYSYTDQLSSAGTFQYRVKSIAVDGSAKYSSPVKVDVGFAPRSLALEQNFPNPFNPSTRIRFSVPNDGRATLRIYDITGRELATLFDGVAIAGRIQAATFDASLLASGVYFARLESGNSRLTRKMLLLR